MAEKREISYEQAVALDRGRQVARSNQRRRVAANRAADAAAAAREEARRAEAAHELDLRYGFEIGDLVTGRERTFGSTKTGVVIEGPRSERGQGVFVRDAGGNEWLLAGPSVRHGS